MFVYLYNIVPLSTNDIPRSAQYIISNNIDPCINIARGYLPLSRLPKVLKDDKTRNILWLSVLLYYTVNYNELVYIMYIWRVTALCLFTFITLYLYLLMTFLGKMKETLVLSSAWLQVKQYLQVWSPFIATP
jgi:hypothetical protein